MSIKKEKYQNAILYLCSKLGGEIRGKKKLAKLLYFVDFDFYEQNQTSVTGDTYKALPMGPFPTALEEITQEMLENKMLSIEQIEGKEGYNPTEVYKNITTPNETLLSNKEKQMLDRVVIKYGHLTGKQLEDLSHAEAPYIGTPPRAEIPYELAFYRDTDFSNVPKP